MLAEQNTYIVKWVARCKETRENMSRKQLTVCLYQESRLLSKGKEKRQIYY